MSDTITKASSKIRNAFGILCLATVSLGLLLIGSSYIHYRRQAVLRIDPKFLHKKSGRGQDLKKHLQRACESLKERNITLNQEPVASRNWLVSDRFKIIACKNRKVGTTNIARVMYALDHMTEYTDSNKIKKGRARNNVLLLRNGSKSEIHLNPEALNMYTKIMFVRDPLERLLSAYRDHRPRSWFLQKRLPFQNYLVKVVHIPDNKIDLHLKSYTKVCNPCMMEYNFVGLLKNFEQEMKRILKRVGATNAVILPKRNETGYQVEQSDRILKSYIKLLPKSLIRKVYNKYYWDYYLFGFKKLKF